MRLIAEFTWTWERYKKLFIEDKRIINGKKFIKENKSLFDQVEKDILTEVFELTKSYRKD